MSAGPPFCLKNRKKICSLEKSSYLCIPNAREQAEIAQLVEHDLAKVGVASSSLVFRSTSLQEFLEAFFCCGFSYDIVIISMTKSWENCFICVKEFREKTRTQITDKCLIINPLLAMDRFADTFSVGFCCRPPRKNAEMMASQLPKISKTSIPS